MRVGIMGAGAIAIQMAKAINGLKDVEAYAIASRSLDKANEFKNKYGFEKAYGSYEELLADDEVKAVYIPLPNQLHYEWVIKAINAGKHVLCEKPITPTVKQAEELYNLAKEKNVLLMEAFAYLHTPYIDGLKKEIDDNRIGKVSYIESAFLTSSHI